MQAKLSVNQPGDLFEQQADQVVDRVMRMPEPAAVRGGRFSRRAEAVDCAFQPPSGGRPLPDSERRFFESRFGRDFGHVRIYADTAAAESARWVNALAYTVGRNIFFGAGQYASTTSTGRRLLAHELVHTIQQTGEGISSQDRPRHLQRTIGDGHDLQSPRFAGDPVLEACFDNERLLRFGSRGPAVEKIQQALVDAGFPLPSFGVDGIFASETLAAVRDYQRAHGLDPDGLVGPLTMGSLDALFAAPTPPAPTPPAPTPPAPTPPSPAPPTPTPPTPPSPVPTPPAPPVPAPTVPVSIRGGTELWHFNGAAPAGYPLQQTLTASAGGLPGSFSWNVVTGPNIAGFRVPPVPFALPFAFTPSVVLQSIAPSRLLNDIQVTVDFTGVSGATGRASRNFTVRAPRSMTRLANTPSGAAFPPG
ncbi:MAG: DUF4157 domain-containing protein, partial [Deltaproteobacteria bacterium]|nr:DUF4157 domain-containing protein [Deltaproteobacteria bacterium]